MKIFYRLIFLSFVMVNVSAYGENKKISREDLLTMSKEEIIDHYENRLSTCKQIAKETSKQLLEANITVQKWQDNFLMVYRFSLDLMKKLDKTLIIQINDAKEILLQAQNKLELQKQLKSKQITLVDSISSQIKVLEDRIKDQDKRIRDKDELIQEKKNVHQESRGNYSGKKGTDK